MSATTVPQDRVGSMNSSSSPSSTPEQTASSAAVYTPTGTHVEVVVEDIENELVDGGDYALIRHDDWTEDKQALKQNLEFK